MKKLIILIFLCSFSYLAQAQLKSNTPNYTSSFKNFAEKNPDYFTDTLVFVMPNKGQLEAIFNSNDYPKDDIEEKLLRAVKSIRDFNEDGVRTYYLHPNWAENTFIGAIKDIITQYIPHRKSYTLGIPFGLDFIGGKFAPEMGFRTVVNLKKIGLGASITNSVFFSDKPDGGVNVFHNPFINAEILINPTKAPWSTIQIGYLLNDSGPVFQGTTLKASYRYNIKGNLQLNGGFIFTDNIKTIIPTVGVRLF
ncbi:hypothetical protein [Belliella aquatica]|uniref:Uncharacterized protein n=1 Tax=Belliella aquatica TaxID=1323734 RepID=A0ABQ1MZP0_9BACT|nr:hypothetical protein [Belliella aquatica]MCH7403960.1 hypothetical protein [Belliella aquatica]GGC50241.1 hypothetical protein GCM10010993_31010 [Belliella aquatica]